MGASTRLALALGAAVALVALALLTWIAVRLEQVRRSLRAPAPPPAEPTCDRLHVADVGWRSRAGEEGEPYLAAEDLPAFRGPIRPPVDEDLVNPTFPVPRRR